MKKIAFGFVLMGLLALVAACSGIKVAKDGDNIKAHYKQ